MQGAGGHQGDRDQKIQRIAELEALCNDRQTAMERLQAELAKAGVIKDKFDFEAFVAEGQYEGCCRRAG